MTKFLSPCELAQELGVSAKFIYKLLWKNQIPGASQLGRRWFIDKQIFFASLYKQPTRPKPSSDGGSTDHLGD
jgi:excisionase family DNA binding protein